MVCAVLIRFINNDYISIFFGLFSVVDQSCKLELTEILRNGEKSVNLHLHLSRFPNTLSSSRNVILQKSNFIAPTASSPAPLLSPLATNHPSPPRQPITSLHPNPTHCPPLQYNTIQYPRYDIIQNAAPTQPPSPPSRTNPKRRT
jgi:hypothetical protein